MQGHTIFSREFLSLNTTNQEYQLLLSAEDFVCGEWIDGTFQENPFTQFNKQAVRSLTVNVQETDYLIELGDITFSSERNYHILANDIGHRIENLSYYHPEFYPFFAKYDAEHDWAGLNVSTFNAYKNAASALFHDDQQNSYYGTGMLIPDWTYIQTDGSYTDIDIAEEYQQFDFISGWEAHRIYYNLSLNYYLYGKLLAQNLMLQDTYNFFRDILQSKGYLSSGYAINGQNVSAYGLNQESLATNSTYLALFMLNNDHYYANILAHKLLREYNNVGYFGSNPHDYYAQNWAWFGLWLYTTRAKNLRDLISGD
jgi:hypothetical protein